MSMKLKDFKDEFRLVSTDEWGDTLEAWFEAVGQLYDRGKAIPQKYEYRPSPFGGADQDSYWHDMFQEASTEDLYTLAEFLFRYASLLRYQGKDY